MSLVILVLLHHELAGVYIYREHPCMTVFQAGNETILCNKKNYVCSSYIYIDFSNCYIKCIQQAATYIHSCIKQVQSELITRHSYLNVYRYCNSHEQLHN